MLHPRYYVQMDWMALHIELPHDEGQALLNFLRVALDMKEIDFCEMQNPQRARVGWGPCPPRIDSGYTIDPFRKGI